MSNANFVIIDYVGDVIVWQWDWLGYLPLHYYRCVCVHFACKGRPRNDLYCVGQDVKPYSLTHSLIYNELSVIFFIVTGASNVTLGSQ